MASTCPVRTKYDLYPAPPAGNDSLPRFSRTTSFPLPVCDRDTVTNPLAFSSGAFAFTPCNVCESEVATPHIIGSFTNGLPTMPAIGTSSSTMQISVVTYGNISVPSKSVSSVYSLVASSGSTMIEIFDGSNRSSPPFTPSMYSSVGTMLLNLGSVSSEMISNLIAFSPRSFPIALLFPNRVRKPLMITSFDSRSASVTGSSTPSIVLPFTFVSSLCRCLTSLMLSAAIDESPIEAEMRLSRVKSSSGTSAALKSLDGTLDQYEEPMTNTINSTNTSSIQRTSVFDKRRRKREDVECAPYLELRDGAWARLSMAMRTVFLVPRNGRSSSLGAFGSFISIFLHRRGSSMIKFKVC